MIGTAVFVIILLLIIGIGVSSVKVVRQSETRIVERLGKFNRQLGSGLYVIVPILDRVVANWDMRTQIINSNPQPVITKDNVTMHIDTLIYYRVTDARAATYEINGLQNAIANLAVTALRNEIGNLYLDETLNSRDAINAALQTKMDEATNNWGVKVERVELKEIITPQDIRDAMEKQMRAERNKRSQILEAEGERAAAIERAEGKKRAQILEAEASSEAQIRQAEGEAKAIELVAAARRKQIHEVYTALKDVEANDKVIALRYVEALEKLAASDNKVFVPYEAAGLMGSAGALQNLIQAEK
ncbi:SPFH/Band 7/PHB domain protein [Aneurinibacillus sp. Ricciae_BoGa-3]|uniref:SPFH domain-containing protein n=1 Tax=Aneurinibacillus sp. Ricciae_BoGa-3 TaxID=3022697 RepID=UPI002341B7CE|nr:SPFH domain-containing protein [Aneurinibacillus sp. Ricciae_BoGa-3]WCK52716.1 SPFH/Band 7/PHB domain protein [Aneurinibacillus sp. Ricciae_BoGa-3]